jgi:hypothetical protein
MALTPLRRLILGLALAAVCASAIYPPWRTGNGSVAPRHLIFQGPQPSQVGASRYTFADYIDWGRLRLEWVGIATLAAAAAVLSESFGRKKSGGA